MIYKRHHPIQPGPLPLIPLGRGLFAIVDLADYAWLKRYRWFAKRSKSSWYAVRRIRRFGKDRLIRMHREIMQCPTDFEVHHINANSLDNRRRNLLVCTHDEHIAQHNKVPRSTRTPTPHPTPTIRGPTPPTQRIP